MKTIRSVFRLLTVSALAAGLVLTIQSPASHAEQPKFAKIAGSGLAGTWFRISAMAAAILNEKVPGTTFSATLGGGITNIQRIEAGDLEMGLAMTSGLGFAHYGKGPFKDKKTEGVAAITVLFQSPYHLVVRKDSPIKSPADLAGKSIAVGKSGWSTELFAQSLLEAYGLSYDKIRKAGGKIHFVGWGEMTRLLKDNRIDAAFFATPVPVPQLLDVTTATPIRVLNIDDKQLKWFSENYPAYYEMTIPAGAYKGHDTDVTTLGDSVTLTVNKNIDADLIYNVTKALFENKKVLVKVHKAVGSMSPENALKGVKIPLHPGAYRYYKEIGVEVPKENVPAN